MIDNITDEDRESLKECILDLIDDYINKNPQLMQEEKWSMELYFVILDLGKKIYDIEIISEQFLRSEINNCIEFYFQTVGIPRSLPDSITFTQTNEGKEQIKTLLENLRKIPQEKQLEEAWFIKRASMLTASSIWKCLDTPSSVNSIIYKKCSPIDIKKYKSVNINSPFHHGHKYEPLSTQFYEQKYNTKIGEWGCIPHPSYSFIGASPDGINTDYHNSRYGRLLEIKNIVNREITGVPLKKYWIQMQLQMEVTNIPYCDFCETRFKEFQNEEEFEKGDSFHLTDDGKMKGIFIQFHGVNGPIYKYPPFQCSRENFNLWYEQCIDKHSHLSWVKNIYWWLDECSCVLVQRNKKWFKDVLPRFKEIWDIIIKERDTGFEHRKPKRRIKKKTQENTRIFRIRTESFSETQINEVVPES